MKIRLPLAALLLACAPLAGSQLTPAEKGPKDYYKAYFPVGVAVGPSALKGPGSGADSPTLQ